MLKRFLTVKKITATLKFLNKPWCSHSWVSFRKTSVRNDLGTVNPALEGTVWSTILFSPFYFLFFSVQTEENFKREINVFFFTHSLPEILAVRLTTTVNNFCRVKLSAL